MCLCTTHSSTCSSIHALTLILQDGAAHILSQAQAFTTESILQNIHCFRIHNVTEQVRECGQTFL